MKNAFFNSYTDWFILSQSLVVNVPMEEMWHRYWVWVLVINEQSQHGPYKTLLDF